MGWSGLSSHMEEMISKCVRMCYGRVNPTRDSKELAVERG